jgi:hypothetical protein
MRLSLRIERLEARPAPTPSPALDVCRLSEADLRLLAKLPIGEDGEVDLSRVSDGDLDRLEAMYLPLEQPEQQK